MQHDAEDADDYLHQGATNGRSISGRSGAIYRSWRSPEAARAQGLEWLEWLGLQGLFAEQRSGRGTSWSYVGDGRGAYEQLEEFRFVGEGAGSFDKQEDTVIRPSSVKPGCMFFGLLLIGLMLVSTVLAVGLYSASSPKAPTEKPKVLKLAQAQQVQTTLLAAASAGDAELQVASEEGFEVGDSVIISDGYSSSETKTISAFGSILLGSPLERPFAEGSAVTKAPRASGDVLLSEPAHAGDNELQVSSFGDLAVGATVQIGRHRSDTRTVVALKWKHRVVVAPALQRAYSNGTRVAFLARGSEPTQTTLTTLTTVTTTAISTTSTTAISTTTSVTSSTSSPLYECKVESDDEAMLHWSAIHQAYCCETHGLACRAETTVTSTTSFYDCGVGRSDWEFGWTPMKLAWCCGRDRNLSSCPLVGTSAPFDCAAGLSNWERGWSTWKQEWCCRNQAVACSYSCEASEEEQESWTSAKREWCCKQWGRGCERRQPDAGTTCDGGLNFSDVAYSNLGDQGPDFGFEPAVRYRNVCEVNSQPIDLVLRAAGEYEPALARHNGHNGLVGRINIKYGTSVDLIFAFMEAGGDVPVQVPRVFFTLLDIDRSEVEMDAESVLIKNFSLFYLDNDTTVHYQPVGPGGARFSSTRMGDLTDNPSNMSNLSAAQRRKAVTLLFLNTSSFPVSFEASGKKKAQGRVFMFGGKRDLSASHGTLVGPWGPGWSDSPDRAATADGGQKPERPAQDAGAARLTCRLDCSVDGAARPVKLHVGRAGDSFVPRHAATTDLDREACASACLATPGCDGVAYGNGTCYGVWDVRTSECKRGDIGDYQTQFLTGRPWGRCALVADAHLVTFDRMYGPDLAEYEPADYHLVRSDHLEVQAQLGRTAASPEASAIVGIAVTGALLGGRALVAEYLGPALGRRGFRVTWDGEEILAEYPSRYRAADGVLSARHWRGDPAWRHWQARNILSNYSDSLPSYFFEFPPHLEVHMLLGPDSCGVILAMQKLGVGQEGLCGNFNCDGIDDAYMLIEERGRVAPVQTGESLFRSVGAGQDNAEFKHQQRQRRKQLFDDAREACAADLLWEAKQACIEAHPKSGLQGSCVAEACAANSTGLVEMQAAIQRLEPGLLAPR